MHTQHPTYPNPTIQEALCEIHFRLPDQVEWKPTLFGEIFKHIQPEFPEFEPLTQVGFRMQVRPSGMEQQFLPPQPRMRYKHATRNLLLQLSPNILTVNVLPQYAGWVQMSQDILQGWTKVSEVIEPASITRIGLRYINRIDRTQPTETSSHWLASSDYLPKSVLSSLPGFLSRVETRMNEHYRLIVTLGEMSQPVVLEVGAIVFDIDCIVEKEMSITAQAITAEINGLHDTAWRIFSDSMTPRLAQLLQKEVKHESSTQIW
jgi:uncharacterized protein (TIGR04255 family)